MSRSVEACLDLEINGLLGFLLRQNLSNKNYVPRRWGVNSKIKKIGNHWLRHIEMRMTADSPWLARKIRGRNACDWRGPW